MISSDNQYTKNDMVQQSMHKQMRGSAIYAQTNDMLQQSIYG